MGELGAASVEQPFRPLGCGGALKPLVLPFGEEPLPLQLGGEGASRGLLLPAPAASKALPLPLQLSRVGAPQGDIGVVRWFFCCAPS